MDGSRKFAKYAEAVVTSEVFEAFFYIVPATMIMFFVCRPACFEWPITARFASAHPVVTWIVIAIAMFAVVRMLALIYDSILRAICRARKQRRTRGLTG